MTDTPTDSTNTLVYDLDDLNQPLLGPNVDWNNVRVVFNDTAPDSFTDKEKVFVHDAPVCIEGSHFSYVIYPDGDIELYNDGEFVTTLVDSEDLS